MITREHGSWAVFGVPLVLAGFLGREWFPWLLLFAVSALAVFMSYVPVQILLRGRAGAKPGERRRAVRWAALYLVVGFATALPLILGRWPALAAFGLAGAILFLVHHGLTRMSPRTVAGDLVAVAGLTLTGPAGLYVATGSLKPGVWLVWLLCFAFFAGTMVHVHMHIAARQRPERPLPLRERLGLATGNLLYQVSALSSIGVLAAAAITPWAALAAYLPMTVQVVTGMLRLGRQVKFKSLGLTLLGQSLLFGSVLAMVL